MLNAKELKALSTEELVKLLKGNKFAEPKKFTLALDTLTVNKELGLMGNYFGIIEATSVTAKVSVAFNRADASTIDFTKGLYAVYPFDKVYLSWAAQAGETIDILIGSLAPDIFEIKDYRSQNNMQATLDSILAELRGITAAGTFAADVNVSTVASVLAANTSRKSLLICADVTNTALVYLGYADTTTSTKKIAALAAGQSLSMDDYRGPIYAISASGTQKLNVSEN